MIKRVAIIGCGFAGTMTAIHLIRKAKGSLELLLFDLPENFNRGVAYNTYSKKHILNVVGAKMSAFPDQPDHFLDWISKTAEFAGIDRSILAQTYLPRHLYGRYIEEIWKDAVQSAPAGIHIRVIHSLVNEMFKDGNEISFVLANGQCIRVNYCVIATGNNKPADPKIINNQFYSSKLYLRNPWKISTVLNLNRSLPVLILGNGLTMVDTVIGLQENGYNGTIHTLSPHGFTILPHKYPDIVSPAILRDLKGIISLPEIFKIVSNHIRKVSNLGFHAGVVADAMRPVTQEIWQNFSKEDKKTFISKLRYRWDSVRHRIPIHMFDRIEKLRSAGKLVQHAGNLVDIEESNNCVKVRFRIPGNENSKEFQFSAVINCTGPATDVFNSDNPLLKSCLANGTIQQDNLKLGILADPETFRIYNSCNERSENIYAIGSLLKGVLWESTAVKELREQAEIIASQLTKMIWE